MQTKMQFFVLFACFNALIMYCEGGAKCGRAPNEFGECTPGKCPEETTWAWGRDCNSKDKCCIPRSGKCGENDIGVCSTLNAAKECPDGKELFLLGNEERIDQRCRTSQSCCMPKGCGSAWCKEREHVGD